MQFIQFSPCIGLSFSFLRTKMSGIQYLPCTDVNLLCFDYKSPLFNHIYEHLGYKPTICEHLVINEIPSSQTRKCVVILHIQINIISILHAHMRPRQKLSYKEYTTRTFDEDTRTDPSVLSTINCCLELYQYLRSQRTCSDSDMEKPHQCRAIQFPQIKYYNQELKRMMPNILHLASSNIVQTLQ